MLISEAKHLENLAWEKCDGLIPAIVQHAFDGRVLMQAYMNKEAMIKTLDSGKVTFWSRSRQTLWTKGETSGHTLKLASIHADCDQDSLLVLANPIGPTCHMGTNTCFDGDGDVMPELAFLAQLDQLVEQRNQNRPQGSYTTKLFEAGTKRIAQKVGEEGVETALAAAAGDQQELRDESADLIYHLVVLLRSRELSLNQVISTLRERHG